MSQVYSALAGLYRYASTSLDRVTEGFTDSDWHWKPQAGGNPAHWILGHVVLYRRTFLRGLGHALPDAPWEAQYKKGSPTPQARMEPSADVLKSDFRRSGELISERLTSLSEEEARAPWSRKFPDGSETVGGAAHFLVFHEAAHLGQIGILRRILGKPGLG